MNQATAFFDVEQMGEMLILKPVTDLHELGEMELEGAENELLDRMDHSGLTDVFLDIHQTDVAHSQSPRMAVELWQRVRSHGGVMAIGLI